MKYHLIYITLLLLLQLCTITDGLLTITLELKKIKTTDQLNDNTCCDSTFICRYNPCDTWLHIEATQYPYNAWKTPVYSADTYIVTTSSEATFTSDQVIGKNLTSQMKFNYNPQQNNTKFGIGLSIKAYDDDDNEKTGRPGNLANSGLITEFGDDIVFKRKDFSVQETLQGKNSGAQLTIKVSIACAPDYFGDRCEKYCKVTDKNKNQGKCNTTTGIKTCNQGWTGDSCDKAICSSSCNTDHANCTEPGECNCHAGWKDGDGTTKTCNTCQKKLGCVNGKCIDGNDCICNIGWSGEFCNKAICSSGCDLKHANCTQPGECNCHPGWKNGKETNKSCDTCITKPGCVNGKCVLGNDCVCNNGWGGAICDEATCSSTCNSKHGSCTTSGICKCQAGWKDGNGTKNTCNTCMSTPGCANGICVDGNDCVCTDGWNGTLCDKAICSPDCDLRHGSCITPGTCKCQAGWKDETGSKNTCNTCVPKQGCVNGNCTKGDDCICRKGWKGDLCDIAICSPDCDLQHGSCTTPDTCKCRPGWKDGPGSTNTCNTCVPKQGCVNGKCTNGNDCACDEGWKGDLCDIVIEVVEEKCMVSYCNTTNTKECNEKENITKCTCNEGWEGLKCNESSSKGKTQLSQSGIIPPYIKIGALVLGGIVILLIIATLIVTLFCRTKKRSRLESSGSGIANFHKVFDGMVNETFHIERNGVDRSIEMRPKLQNRAEQNIYEST